MNSHRWIYVYAELLRALTPQHILAFATLAKSLALAVGVVGVLSVAAYLSLSGRGFPHVLWFWLSFFCRLLQITK
jgi:hypothetical protein